jgi:hypothetical protein
MNWMKSKCELAAAQNLNRQWIGIDISPTACRVMAKRLRDVCGLPESAFLLGFWQADICFWSPHTNFSASRIANCTIYARFLSYDSNFC